MELVRGWRWRERNEYRRLAWALAWNMAPHVTKPLTPKDILGDDGDETVPQKRMKTLDERFDYEAARKRYLERRRKKEQGDNGD